MRPAGPPPDRPDRPPKGQTSSGDASPAPRAPGGTAVPANRYVLFLGIVGGGLVADLATKHFMFARLGPPSRNVAWVWPGVFGFQTSLNEGALFGVGQGLALVFAALSLVAIAGIVGWLFVAGGAKSRWLCTALGCVSVGVLGNLYDRLGLHGLRWTGEDGVHAAGQPVHAVRDWILVMIGPYPWPNFNLADAMLVCGAALLAWHALRGTDGVASEAGHGPVGSHGRTERPERAEAAVTPGNRSRAGG